MPNETIQNIATVFPINAEALKPDPKYRRRVSIIKEFSLNTSTHGIPGIARSQSIPNRIFWCLSLLVFTGVMTYFVVQAITTYFQYPTQTSVTTIAEWPQAFPAVTVCNYSPIRYDRFNNSFFDYLKQFNLTNATDLNKFTIEHSKYVQNFLIYKLTRNESLHEYFYSLESMLISCNFNGVECSARNFTWFVTSTYGLCYTFNAKLKNVVGGGIKTNTENGGIGTLTLRFYTHEHQYVPYLSYGSGIVALVHDNSQIPNVDLGSMLFGPGQHHRLTYTKRKYTFLHAPYTNCQDKQNLAMQVIFDQYNDTDYGYTQFECFVVCIQAYTYEKCGCGNPFRWNIHTVVLSGTNKVIEIPLCAINNPCYVAAAAEFMNTVSIWSNYCPDCRPECSTVDFTIKASSLTAPRSFYYNTIKNFAEQSDVPLPMNWSTSWMNEIELNYVSLEVSFETTRTELYTQQATIEPVDVISNVGGQTGLWIGISFLSIMEIIEMVYRLLRRQSYSFRKKFTRRRRKASISQ